MFTFSSETFHLNFRLIYLHLFRVAADCVWSKPLVRAQDYQKEYIDKFGSMLKMLPCYVKIPEELITSRLSVGVQCRTEVLVENTQGKLTPHLSQCLWFEVIMMYLEHCLDVVINGFIIISIIFLHQFQVNLKKSLLVILHEEWLVASGSV